VILSGTDWFNHLQFSPTDPTMLMYCHEGSGWRVDRIWIHPHRRNGEHNDPRRADQEPNPGGRACRARVWSPDGRTIYVDLRFIPGFGRIHRELTISIPGSTRGITTTRTRSRSIQNLSPERQALLRGRRPRTGGAWIFIFHPTLLPDDQTLGTDLIQVGSFQVGEALQHGKAQLPARPNVSFTPDQKYIIFRSDMLGKTYPFAVEGGEVGPAVASTEEEFGRFEPTVSRSVSTAQ